MGMAEARGPVPDAARPSRARRIAIVGLHLLVALIIGGVAAGVFLSTLSCGFVYDDAVTVVGNRLIDHLSLLTMVKLFGGFHLYDYYPIFYLSLAVDRAVWGHHPWGYHLTNIVLHIANTLLVYAMAHRFVVRVARQTPAPGINRWLVAAMTALLFAVHPNHVEPVAWVSGRKVLLATFWGLLAIHAYATALHGPGRRPSALLGSVLCTALACMSNAYAVVLPALIALCDRYLGGQRWIKTVGRNWPFVLIAVGALVLKVASRTGGIAKPSPFHSRLEWLATTTAIYALNVRSLFTTTGRNVLYVNEMVRRLDEPAFLWGVVAVGATVLLVWTARRRPLWMIGTLWFLLALGPTTQLARHHILRADRYLYLPGIGTCLLGGVVIGTAWGWSRRRIWRGLLIVGCVVVVARFASASRARTYDWRDDASLWASSLAQDERNADAHQSLGTCLMDRGRPEEALAHLHRALELSPGHPDAHNSLSALMIKLGRIDEAVRAGRLAVQGRPDFALARFNLGQALMLQGRYEHAVEQFRRGLALSPDDPVAHYYEGQALSSLRRWTEAIQAYEQALALRPDYIEARYALAAVLVQTEQFDRARRELTTTVTMQPGFAEAHCRLAELALRRRDYAEAIARYRTAVVARPDLKEPRNALAWLLATSPHPELRNGTEALTVIAPLSEDAACEDPFVLDTLAAVHAELGQFPQAIPIAQKAHALAVKAGLDALATAIQQRLERYAAGQPHREPSP